MLTEEEKKSRRISKELKSFRNKMTKNLIWFDALSKQKQLILLMSWKTFKFNNKIKKTEIVKVRRWGRTFQHKIYPPSLKHFIEGKMTKTFYKPDKSKFRESVINLILDN